MEIENLQQQFNKLPERKVLAALADDVKNKRIHLSGLIGSSVALALSTLQKRKGSTVIVCNDADAAGYLFHDLEQLRLSVPVLFFPSAYRRALKYGQLDAASEILRIEVLNAISNNQKTLVVTYPEALAERVIPDNRLKEETLHLRVGQKIDPQVVAKRLFEQGFERVDYVYQPGQYAVRGSLMDLYSFAHELPYRIDFFGREIDSIREFDIASQLSQEKVEELFVVPALRQDGKMGVSITSFLPSDTLLATVDAFWCIERVKAIANETLSDGLIASQDGDTHAMDRVVDAVVFETELSHFRRIDFGTRTMDTPDVVLRYEITPQPSFQKNFDLVSVWMKEHLQKGYQLMILSENPKQIDRLQSIFDDRGDQIAFTPVLHTLHEGFIDHQSKICYLTDHQLFDRYHKYNLKSDRIHQSKPAISLKELQQFEIGDYLVHIDHGVGRFGGLVSTPINGKMQEVIKMVYMNNDTLFVPIHALHKLSKYRGKEGEPPRMTRLGSGQWDRMKEKTKGKMKEIARDLIKLYAKRKSEKGFAFSPDTYLQQELEASFIYEDTPDQLTATAQVKEDMERDRPMDRLICGDVGFGKTEVAIRAAFKAATDGKQVAVLVPTTVLAFQHYNTFKDRLKEFPVKVEYLSRARKVSEVKRILTELQDGSIDIVIGTHKLIGKDVKFKDLGLLVVDEEQKFGVSVKEKLKQMRASVDTLTMSATPIPRTLQFSLMGARDLSVISTPPPNRYPIITELHPYTPEMMAEAINFEMSRNGQVFVISNRISELHQLEQTIRKYVPDARVAIGHGQMEPHKLEEIIVGFVQHDFDVLVATTIIESGIDIPNANTMIVHHAQNFGLSELHQLRGRVGRSDKKAFCYLFSPPLSLLSNDARRRLQAIESFSDLGSGIHIAMQDLDIRGAGNLLGAEQSGFIADLGYETYQKVLKEALEELKNEEFETLFKTNEDDAPTEQLYVTDCLFESDLQLSFPEEYIPGTPERISLYQQLDNMERPEDILRFREQITDRFGPIPEQSEELIRVVTLRRLGKSLGIEKVVLRQGKMILYFVGEQAERYFQSDTFGRLLAYLQLYPRKCQLKELRGKRSMTIERVDSVHKAVQTLEEICLMSMSE